MIFEPLNGLASADRVQSFNDQINVPLIVAEFRQHLRNNISGLFFPLRELVSFRNFQNLNLRKSILRLLAVSSYPLPFLA